MEQETEEPIDEIMVQTKEKNGFKTILKTFLNLLRVKQWIKNGFVGTPVVLLFALPTLEQIKNLAIGIMLFSIVSSTVYIMNDVADIEKDKLHPKKKKRPIASGKVSIRLAYFIMVLMLFACLYAAFWFDRGVAIMLFSYFIMNVAYTFHLKKFMYIDVFIISFGFLLRIAVGLRILDLSLTDPVNLCFGIFVLFLTLFIGIGKRYDELMTMKEDSANFRQSLEDYSIGQLDQTMGILMACAIMSYTMFLFETAITLLFTTLPLLLYSVLRFRYLRDKSALLGSPEKVIYKDAPIRWCILLWGALFVGICAFQAYL